MPHMKDHTMPQTHLPPCFSRWSRTTLMTLPLLLTGCLTVPEKPGVEPTAQAFETPEYHAQKGLAIIKASALYARGGSGQGVSVALVDSGLNADLPEFSGRIS